MNVLQCDVLVLVRDRQEELQVEITERKKAIEIEEKEIVRKEKELEGIVRKPAEAEAFRVEQVANASRYQFISSPFLYFSSFSFLLLYLITTVCDRELGANHVLFMVYRSF